VFLGWDQTRPHTFARLFHAALNYSPYHPVRYVSFYRVSRIKYAKVFILCQISEVIFRAKVVHNSDEIGILHSDVDLR